MTLPPYPYSQGERLEDRNTYFYSAYHGQPFFAAWQHSRHEALARLPAAIAPRVPAAQAAVNDETGYDTEAVLALLLQADLGEPGHRRLAEHLLQRFEVSKRLYRRYTPAFKAELASGYDNLALYRQFGALCVAMRAQPNALPFLNGLLKVIDTLISVPPSADGELAWLIEQEADWVAALAAKTGVELGL